MFLPLVYIMLFLLKSILNNPIKKVVDNAIIVLIAFLVIFSQVQKKIQEELDCKIGMERPPSLNDRGKLPYLEATIREVLRIRPVSPLLIPHVALTNSRYIFTWGGGGQ